MWYSCDTGRYLGYHLNTEAGQRVLRNIAVDMTCVAAVWIRGVARGVAWRGVVWRGVAWRGVAWRGVAWRGVA